MERWENSRKIHTRVVMKPDLILVRNYGRVTSPAKFACLFAISQHQKQAVVHTWSSKATRPQLVVEFYEQWAAARRADRVVRACGKVLWNYIYVYKGTKIDIRSYWVKLYGLSVNTYNSSSLSAWVSPAVLSAYPPVQLGLVGWHWWVDCVSGVETKAGHYRLPGWWESCGVP